MTASPLNHPMTGIKNWNKPKDDATRTTCAGATDFMEMLPLRATAKQSADKLSAMRRMETNSVITIMVCL